MIGRVDRIDHMDSKSVQPDETSGLSARSWFRNGMYIEKLIQG